MVISLIYHSALLVTSPVSQSQLVQWYISYVAIFEFFHSSVNHSSAVKWASWVNDDDFLVYLLYTTTFGLLYSNLLAAV